MTEQDISPATPYEPPRIEARASIEGHLVALTSGETPSAAFRPLGPTSSATPYEPPRIETRTSIDGTLQILTSTPV